jgi:hypothetical protein
MVQIIWNPKDGAPQDEDCVILRSHQHSQRPQTVLGHFKASRQTGDLEAAFSASNFDLPFPDAFKKAKAFANAHGISKLIVIDAFALGQMTLDKHERG